MSIELIKGMPDWNVPINANFAELEADKTNILNTSVESTGYGIISGLTVSAQSTPNMTVNVATGIVHMANGVRLAPTGNSALTITPSDTTNSRIDIVYVNADSTIGYTAGTPATTPVAPSTPTGAFLLAQINVVINVTTIVSANITDKRKIKNTTDSNANQININTTNIATNTASLSDVMQQTIPASSFGIKGDNITNDQPLLNTLLNTNNDTAIDLNVGRCNLNTTLNITKPNTSIEGHAVSNGQTGAYRRSVLSANHVNTILNVDIPNGENGADIRKITLDGNNMATLGLNYADYSNGRNLLEDVNVVNINGVALQYNGDDYATRVNRFYARYCTKGLVMKGQGHYNIIFENCRFLADQCVEIGLESTASTMKQIIFRGCDFECTDVLASNIQNWLKLGGANEIVFEDCYFESSSTGLKASSLIQLGTATLLLSSVTFTRCHFAPSTGSCDFIFDWKNISTCIIDNCYFENTGVKGIIDASSNTAYTKYGYPLSYWINTPITDVNAVIATNDGVNAPKKMEDIFCIITGKSNYNQPTHRKSVSIQPDSTGIALSIKDQDNISFPYEYARVAKNAISFGSGTTSLDCTFVRYGANIGGMSGNQSFKVDGTYNGGHLIMGTNHLWFDALGKPRVKSPAIPYSDTDAYSLVRAQNSPPTSATDTGVTGDIAITTGYIYICVATNTWQRVATTTW